MLTALAFAHFSSELLLKEQMIMPVKKKTLNNAGHIDPNWSILAKFAKKNPAKSAVLYWLFLGEVSSWNFPWNRLIFLRICPRNSFEIWLFSAQIPQNRPIFLRILTFLPQIGRFFCEFLLFSRVNPVKSADFSANCPCKSREILLFFPAKYQKPCIWLKYHSWHFKIVSNFTRLTAYEITYNNFEISLVIFMPNITTNHAITYTNIN